MMPDSNPNAWIPESVDLEKPSAARMYDYMLGGYNNFEIDRVVADQVLALYPHGAEAARANRAFLRRAVTYLSNLGIDQFLDIGSGIPTVGHVHEIAQSINPGSSVVYVDLDPVAIAHSEAMLVGNPTACAIQADLHDPAYILGHENTRATLDFGRPMAVLLVAVLHFVLDLQRGQEIMQMLRDAVAPGSYFVMAHATTDGAPPDIMQQIQTLTQKMSTPAHYRNYADVMSLMDGLEILEPGVVYTPAWFPEGPDELFHDFPVRALTYGGIGRKN